MVVADLAGRNTKPAIFVKEKFFGNYFDLIRKSVTLEFWELLDETNIPHQFWSGKVETPEEMEVDVNEDPEFLLDPIDTFKTS